MQKRSPDRRGFTLFEAFVSMALLGVVLGMIAPLARRSAEQFRRAEAQRIAALEVSNALERLAADPAAAPAAGDERTETPADLPARLRDPRLVVRAVAVPGDLPGRRLDATLSWTEPDGGTASVGLSAFLFGEGRP